MAIASDNTYLHRLVYYNHLNIPITQGLEPSLCVLIDAFQQTAAAALEWSDVSHRQQILADKGHGNIISCGYPLWALFLLMADG